MIFGITFFSDCDLLCDLCFSDNEASSFLSTYACPEPRGVMSQGLLCTITGFLIPEDIHALLMELR